MVECTKFRNKNRGYMKLEVWQKSIELYRIIWKIIYEDLKLDFKLRSQLADATQSFSANIAEGYSRRSIKEYIQFLYISLSCLSDALTRIIGLKVTNQITEEQFKSMDSLHYEIENKLLRLVESLERKRDDGT
jgi:four helix bundle protein